MRSELLDGLVCSASRGGTQRARGDGALMEASSRWYESFGCTTNEG